MRKVNSQAQGKTLDNDCFNMSAVLYNMTHHTTVPLGPYVHFSISMPFERDTTRKTSMDIDRSPNRDLGVESINMHTCMYFIYCSSIRGYQADYRSSIRWCEADGVLKRIGVLTVRFFQKSSIFSLN